MENVRSRATRLPPVLRCLRSRVEVLVPLMAGMPRVQQRFPRGAAVRGSAAWAPPPFFIAPGSESRSWMNIGRLFFVALSFPSLPVSSTALRSNCSGERNSVRKHRTKATCLFLS